MSKESATEVVVMRDKAARLLLEKVGVRHPTRYLSNLAVILITDVAFHMRDCRDNGTEP